MYPNDLDPQWDNKTLNYDLQRHNWPEFWLGVAQEKFPQITQLETVHEILSTEQIAQLANHCHAACDSEEFQRRVDDYFSEYVPNLVYDVWMLQRFFQIRIVVPEQESVGRLLAFHQGIWVGNGMGLRTIWTPFTECYDTNSMWIMDAVDSLDITQETYLEKYSQDKIQELCRKKSKPVTLKPGQAHLFQQNHVHGNYNNTTGITRWSMDGRILIRGGHYHRKLPGGYFRFLGERTNDTVDTGSKSWITYVGWNSKFSSGIPLPMQRATIQPYLDRHNIKINDFQFENEFCDWFPGLEYNIRLAGIGGIVMCSIYCLPDDAARRKELLVMAVENGTELHFANELCQVKTLEDVNHIERIFSFVNENTDPNKTLRLFTG